MFRSHNNEKNVVNEAMIEREREKNMIVNKNWQSIFEGRGFF